MDKHLRGVSPVGKNYPPQGGFVWGILLSLLLLNSVAALAQDTAPVAICKDISVHLGSAGSVSITADDIDNGSYDPDGTVAIFIDITSFDCSNVGSNDVRLIVVDNDDNTTICHSNVTVIDDLLPVPDASSLPDILAECTVEVSDVPVPTATDDCAGTIEATTDATFPISTQGTTVITWTYTDTGGNTVTQTQNVIINDVTNPVPDNSMLADITAQCEVAEGDVTPPTATDNCTGTIEATTNAAFPISDQGTTVITWTYTDEGGNTITQTQNVIITDTTAPTPDAASLADITAQCEVAAAEVPEPTATDNCSGTVTVTNNATFPISTQGTTVITWTFEDANGNTSNQTQNVIIDDTTGPVADVADLPDVTAQCQITAADVSNPTATDNCGGTVTVTNDATFPITTQGTTVVTWTYEDQYGNTSTQTQNMVVTDTMVPVADAASLPDVTDECEVIAADLTEPTATDNCTATVSVTNDATFPITTQGTTVVTWTFTDDAGNTSTQMQNVIINDMTSPVPDAASLADLTDQCEITADDVTEPTATDNCAGIITGTPDVAFPVTATTVITWTYDDGHGNTATQTQNVIINDTQAPVPDLATLADATAQCEVTAVTAPTATDNCSGTITGTTTAVFPITTQGTTLITWTYDDGHGNMSTQTQNIVVDDTEEPAPDLATLADVTAQCEVTAVTAPTATDNCSGTITGTTTAVFPITTQGTTMITWTFDDGNGNTATQTQNIVIDDTMEPTPDLASLADVNAQCEVTSITAPTATDNCTGTITGTTDAVFPIMATTVVTWTYDDGNGNTSTQTQNVVIEDTMAPVADLPTLSDVTDLCEVATITAPTATDNCAGAITGTSDVAFPVAATTVITWTYDDGHGNTSTQTQNVIILDDEAPVPDVATLADVTGPCQVTSVTAPTATDNCAGTVTGTTNAVFPIADPGTTVITWTFTDANGNSATQTQNVIVVASPVADVTFADGTFVYDGTPHSLAVSGLPAGASVSYENNGQTNAGTYQVTATVNPGVSSCPEVVLTATLTIDKAPQTITFDAIPDKNLENDPDFGLTATASSGLPVSYTYTFDAATAPATVSATGDVTLLTSGVVEITASQPGNENYLPADPVTQTLTITSSDARIHEIIINETTYTNPSNEIRYRIECGDNMQQVNVSFTTEVNATADTPNVFVINIPPNGTFTKTIVVTSQDGTKTETYRIIIEKPYTYLNPDIFVIQKFNNVLLINNNPDNNGGYRFVSFKWYMNGNLIGTGQYYSAGESAGNTLNPNGIYYAEMTDANGTVYRTCDFSVSLTSAAYGMTVSPNPTIKGNTIDVKTNYSTEMLTNAKITLTTLYGTPVLQQVTTTNDTRITLPASLSPGIYVVTSEAKTVVLSSKIIVQ